MSFWVLLLILGITAGCLLAARRLIHYFQLESYQFQGYFRTLRRNFPRAILPGLILNLIFAALGIALALAIPDSSLWLADVILALAMTGAGLIIHRRDARMKHKKPLVMTPRVRRLYAAIACGMLLVLRVLTFSVAPVRDGSDSLLYRLSLGIIAFFPLLLPLWVALGAALAWPVETGIKGLYFRDAQKKLLARDDLIKIGITGSWGKTSVKMILASLLKEKYNVLATPGSFNTPMGLTKVIRNDLQPAHHVFIAEMGARHTGEIAELCRLVHPTIGLLTSVGPQHLDTFRTQERITRTKYELMEAVPSDGTCFFADDEGICRELYGRTEKKKILAGLDASRDDVWAGEIAAGPDGSTFTLVIEGRRIPCRTALLGQLNIKNITLCAAVCHELGLRDDQIRRGIEKLRPVQHRLELIRNPGAYTVIDDAFNSNIIGAEQAFHVLKAFPGRRIVVTPGMVELGSREAEMNRLFGEKMAGCCDLAILVGEKRSAAIREGLTAKGFSPERIIVVGSLTQAQQWIRDEARPEDTILFENDLPDNYDE